MHVCLTKIVYFNAQPGFEINIGEGYEPGNYEIMSSNVIESLISINNMTLCSYS